MKLTYLFWPLAFLSSLLFNFLGIPAPWLLGALLVGVIFSLMSGPKSSNGRVFKVAQAFIGVSLGSMLNISLLGEAVTSHLFSIVFALIATLVLGGTLGYTLYKRSELDFKTSMYSFIPGGASEVLGVAHNDGADLRIVAAFHSVRMILFIAIIPLLVGAGTGGSNGFHLFEDLQLFQHAFFPIILIILIAIFLGLRFPIPAGVLFYSTLLAVIYAFFFSTMDVPLIVPGIGQMLIGAMIGRSFDTNAFKMLWRIKTVAVSLVAILIIGSVLIGIFFGLLSGLDIWSAVLSWIPAGAGEMASTAIFLGLDETSVISIQLIRLYTVFLSLPLMVKLVNKFEAKNG
jgi:membrane AbrB-like protein